MVPDELQRGRDAYIAHEWAAASESLIAADTRRLLGPEDLELLATAQFMVGREQDHLAALERAHEGYLEVDANLRAASCAFWIGMRLFLAGEVGRGGGWLARAGRLVEGEGSDCAEAGYLLMPEVFRKEASGDLEGASAAAAAAAEVGRRFDDADLVVLATHSHGQLLIRNGRVNDGLALLDEAMLTVAEGGVSPIPSGIVYCGSIDGCRAAFDTRRAQEWTAALYEWCERQPDMLAFTGDCHVHRAELMQLSGAWSEALEELDRAEQRAKLAGNARVAAHAAYRRGEILRLRGRFASAEDAYREAARRGSEPQPGLALLRLATGDRPAAMAAIRRMLSEQTSRTTRAVQLRACVEIMLDVGDLKEARAACTELESIAVDIPSDTLTAMVRHLRGAVELADGNATAALASLRPALEGWQDLGAPYESAQVRVLVAESCRLLGDEDSAALERETAREVFASLGAAQPGEDPRDTLGLTARELEVLRLIAGGATNKAVAAELVLSERTVDRHVSNIFTKLRVSSRAAATAAAYKHRLL